METIPLITFFEQTHGKELGRERVQKRYLDDAQPGSLEYFMRLGHFTLDVFLLDDGFSDLKTKYIEEGFIVTRAVKKGKPHVFFLQASADAAEKHISAYEADALYGKYAQPEEFPVFCFLSFREPPDDKAAFNFFGVLNEEGLMRWLTVRQVQDRPVFVFFRDQDVVDLENKFVVAYNTKNSNLFDSIFESSICINRASGTYFTKDVVKNNLFSLFARIGSAEIVYLAKAGSDCYVRCPVASEAWFELNMTKKPSICEISVYRRRDGFEIRPNNERLTSCTGDTAPELAAAEAFTPQRSERFALKLLFDNGEKRKYRFPQSDDAEGKEFVTWEDAVFTDKIFASAQVRDNRVHFINGYSIGGCELYAHSRPYLEAERGPALLFASGPYRLEKLFSWDNAWLSRSGPLFKAMHSGKGAWNTHEGYVALCDAQGQRITSLDFHCIGDAHQGYRFVLIGESAQSEYGYAYVDNNFSFLTPPKYILARDFINGFAQVKIPAEKDHVRMINTAGKEIYDHDRYAKAGNFHEGLCRVSLADLEWQLAYHSDYAYDAGVWGYINERGEEVIYPQYIYAFDFTNGFARVCKGKWTKDKKWNNKYNTGRYWTEEELWGLIDKNGNEVIPCQYDELTDICEGRFFSAHLGGWPDGKWGVLDLRQRWVIEPKYNAKLYYAEDGYVVVYEEDKSEFDISGDKSLYGLYDLFDEKLIFEAKYKDIAVIERNKFIVTVDNGAEDRPRELLLDEHGIQIIAGEFISISTAGNYFNVKKIDASGTIVHELIDQNGKLVLPLPAEIAQFGNGILFDRNEIIFKENEKFGVVSFSGDILLSAQYENIRAEKFCTYLVKKDEKYGLLGADKNVLIPPEYEYFSVDEDGVIVLRRQGNSVVARLFFEPASAED
jgi:hypothetical protein